MVELGQADVVQMHWRDWRLWFYFGMLFAGGLGLTVLLLTMTLSGKLLRRYVFEKGNIRLPIVLKNFLAVGTQC